MPMAQVYASTASATTSGIVWANWNSTTTTATTSGIVWANWNQGLASGTTLTTGTAVVQMWPSWNSTYEETREQREARERREAVDARNRGIRERERAAAKERALELLSYCLSAEQLANYREHGWFEVTGSKGRRWRIRARGQSGNVDLMPEIGDERDATYCAHPPEGLPDADAHLAQALTLITDEDAFLRVANRHYVRPGRQAA